MLLMRLSQGIKVTIIRRGQSDDASVESWIFVVLSDGVGTAGRLAIRRAMSTFVFIPNTSSRQETFHSLYRVKPQNIRDKHNSLFQIFFVYKIE